MKEKKKQGAIVRVLAQVGGWHLLGVGLLTNLTEGASNALAALHGGALLDAILSKDSGGMLNSLLLVILFALTLAGSIVIKDTLLGKYLEDGMARLRRRTIEALGRVQLRFVEQRHTGELSARVLADLNALASSLRPVLIMGITSTLARLIPLALLFYTDWLLTLLIFSFLPLTLGLQWVLSGPIKKYRQANQTAVGKLTSVIYDTFGSFESVKSLSLEGEMEKRFQFAQDEQVGAALKENRVMAMLTPLSIFSWLLPQVLLVLIGGAFVLNGRLSYGQLVMFIGLASSATSALMSVGSLFGSLRQLSANAGRIVQMWDEEPERQGGNAASGDGEIVLAFQDASFSYHEDEKTLTDVSLWVNRGEFVAFVGGSGSGKSTALKLAASLYPPSQGDVQLFGQSAEQWDLDAYRSRIAYVTQDTYLFPGSVKENIVSGGETDMQWLQVCIRLANLDEVIDNLPDGLDTNVGEWGASLSGGQRQRVSIARALYKRADILLLDEATSALDSSNEAMVLQGILQMENRPTLIMVTHHIANVENADRIVVFKDGRVAQCADHKTLLLQGGEYAALVARGKEEILF